MSENTGKTRGSLVSAVQSAQLAVGSALTGATGAVSAGVGGSSESIPLLEDLRSIGKENERNTQTMLDTLRSMLQFDKDVFARERDQARELRKEARKDDGTEAKGIGVADMTGDLGVKGIGAIAALAYFANQIGMNTDILKLPQQLKSIRAMANFAKGIGTIATLGLGPKIIDDMKAALKATKINPKMIQTQMDLFDDAVKTRNKGFFGKGGTIATAYTKTIDSIADSFRTFRTAITENRIFKTIGDNFKEAKATLSATFKPVKDALTGTGGLFASAKQGGALAKLIEPLKAIGKTIGKLFFPITLVLGIFDGYTGFMKEYEKEKSFADGIRGAVVGIIDGFIGSFVRLATGAIGKGLEYLGLENVGKMIAEFGEDITKSFSETVGGLVDIVTGIFTLDIERILSGIGATLGGLGDFLFGIVSLPIDTAVNLVKDIFNFGNPDEPFSLKDFFFGEDGPVMTAWNFFKNIFTFNFERMKNKLFDMGMMMKGLAMGGIAAAKAVLPGGESPGEAFKRVFESYVKGNEIEAEPSGEQAAEKIAKASTTDVKGNVTETVFKTETINNNAGGTGATTTVVVDNSTKTANTQQNNASTIAASKMDTGIDGYHDKAANNTDSWWNPFD